MVVLVVTGLRAALEMSRVSRMRVVGEGRCCAPKRHRKRQHKSRDQQRYTPLHLLTPSQCSTENRYQKQRPTTPFFRWGSRLRHWLDPSPLQAPISYGNGFLGLYPDVYDPFKLAEGDESPMNPRRTSQNTPSTHFTGVKIGLATVIFMASGWPCKGHGTLR